MQDSERYLASAQACESMAQSAQTAEERQALLEIAEHWRALVATARRREPRPIAESAAEPATESAAPSEG
jgi:hypothetical protein